MADQGQPFRQKNFDRNEIVRKLTDLQRETLEWIQQYVWTNGIAPSRVEPPALANTLQKTRDERVPSTGRSTRSRVLERSRGLGQYARMCSQS